MRRGRRFPRIAALTNLKGNRMTKLLISTLLGAAVLAASSAHAEDYYAGLTASKGGTLNYRNPLNGKTASDDASAVFKLYGGFALTENYALEAGYLQGGKAHFDKAALGMATEPTFKASNLYLAGRYTHRFNDDWSAFAKLGVVRNRYEGAGGGTGTVSSTKPLLGVGMAYNVTREVALTLDYERMGRTRKQGVNVVQNALQLGVKVGF
jgi:OOP family OmpA-OmpF porin